MSAAVLPLPGPGLALPTGAPGGAGSGTGTGTAPTQPFAALLAGMTTATSAVPARAAAPVLPGAAAFIDRRDPPPSGPWLTGLGLAPMRHRAPRLAWQPGASEERRFWRVRRTSLAAAALLALALPWVPRPAPLVVDTPRPVASARVLLPLPPEPAPAQPSAPPPAQAPAPVPAPSPPAAAAPPVPRAAPPVQPAPAVAPARQPAPQRSPGEALAEARRTAAGVGLLAMKDELAQLSSAPVAAQFRQDIAPGPGVGSGQGVGVGAGTEAGLPARALVTAAAGRSSGGAGLPAGSSRDTGGGGLAGRSTTLVAGVAGEGGAGGGSSARARSGDASGSAVQAGGSGLASRSLEDVKLVFERHKGAIYNLYHRALRDDPTLQGKLVLELKIAANGAVTGLRVLSSELQAPELEARLLARIRSFDFGAREVAPLVVSWPLDFLPS